MAKQKSSQRFVFKINSTRLRDNGWNLNLTTHEARENDELIALSESNVLRFIDEIRGMKNVDEQIKEIKARIKLLKRDKDARINKFEIMSLYKELDGLQFKPDYMCLVVDRIKDYRDAHKHGFTINGITYCRLLGTTGGVKNSTIVFVNTEIADELKRRIANGRNMDMKLVPAKLEAYQALVCSASTPVSQPKGILVVDDIITNFKSNVTHLDDTADGEPVMKDIDDYSVELNVSDGCGMIHPSLSEQWQIDLDLDYLPSAFCTRYSWEKGMLGTFDFIDFAEKIAGTYEVKDVWGNTHDIRDIDMVLTTSMLKLWDSYSSIDDYVENSVKNGYTFNVTKIAPKELENERNLNYQFLQSFILTDEEIQELVQPTIDEIKDVLGRDYRKSILFLKGTGVNDDNVDFVDDDAVKALMIDKNMINDPFVINKIHYMIKKRINNAKTGVIKVNGNFSIIFGDLYALCQNMFKLEVTGLLNASECYSQHWTDRNVDKVAVFRAPMTCHSNIQVLNIASDEELRYWFRYMKTVTILNSWDTTCDALNGADKDGDLILTTNNPILLRNVRKLPAVMCVQRKAEKKIVTEKDLFQSNINSFGDDIGSITNRITSMYERQAMFAPSSLEFKILDYRITSGQLLQQNSIDKSKGIISKPMPKSWYDKKTNLISEHDTVEEIEKKELNMRILADKKPYFMCYIYPSLMTEYTKYISSLHSNCIRYFGLTYEELLSKDEKTDDELNFINDFNSGLPVGMSNCVVNKIAWIFEEEFDGYLKAFKVDSEFDYSILKSNKQYISEIFLAIKQQYELYKSELSVLMQKTKKERVSSYMFNPLKKHISDTFIEKCSFICPDINMLGDIVLDLCYTTNNSKQFAWDLCGEVFIDNLLEKNNNMISYLELDNNGDIEYGGNRFILKTKYIGETEC